ncbi:MAG: long-chain fatty acid--CoA ligase [Deltaproteobacteria bacterium]|nr:long-chain fatty acid--CoA ligase [Deltaproteobacteria bacterium]
MQVIGDIARLNAKRYPDKKALIMGNDTLTYSQLNRQANQLAHGLLSLGVTPGDRVAVLSFNCIECVILQYAVAKCGGIAVPINFRYKNEELIYAINNSNPKVLFFGAEFASLVEEAKTEFISLVQVIALSGETLASGMTLGKLMEGMSTSEPAISIDPGSPFLITYTSGTTGVPKGVLASHAAFLHIYTGLALEGDVHNGEVTLVTMPLFHTGGMHALVQPTLLMGGTAVIMGKGFDPEKILDAVERYDISMTMWVPTMLAMLVNHPKVTKYRLVSLKKIWYGSSAISPTILEASMAIFKTGFYQWYGQTETGMVSVLRPEDHAERSQFTGREMFNADLRIVDEEGKDTRLGETGEIISSQTPLGMIGYHNMDQATQKTVRNGWIHTGDLARVEGDGYFTIVDRMTDMIISGAENIYPKEIEDAISSHPSVLEVAVFGIPDEIYGESVCAVVVKKGGYQVTSDDIISHCAAKMSGYKKPKRVEFIDELPKNASGKVTKNILREPYWAGRKKRV